MADPRPPISEAERAVLKALWGEGPGTVREIQEFLVGQGQDWTRSTVITLLQRLERKGYAQSDRSQFAFVFRAVVSREDMMHQRLTELADELSEGEAAPLVLAFAQRHRFTDEEIAQFREMIDEMAAKRTPRRKPAK
jgi:BlaI family transcriptional regulator, penicillinase repressor